MKWLGVVLLAVAAWFGGYGYGRWYGPKPKAEVKSAEKKYFCPMHPHVRSDRPGTCPICGMQLVEMGSETAAAPMEGTIQVSPEKQQLIGVKFATVELAGGTKNFRTAARVQPDERRVAKVQSRIDGWIEKVFVDFTGKLVRKGDPLLTMYSPEMLASQQEYLLALRSRDVLKNDRLLRAARKRLELFDLSDDQVAQIEQTREPLRNITLHAPMTGFVMVRNAFPKQRITPETELYTLVDLSHVWIVADVFENEASMVREGMTARVSPSFGGRAFAAQVTYIQPQVDMATRTLKIRFEADNPDLALKPDQFVDVDFSVALPRRLTVPADAVLDSGLSRRVFVDRGEGRLEPREVETGERIGDRVEILRGLKAGERVVASGTFLIDSESQLKAAR